MREDGAASIGIEKHEPFAELAAKRMEAELNACPLFEPPTKTIRQGEFALGEKVL